MGGKDERGGGERETLLQSVAKSKKLVEIQKRQFLNRLKILEMDLE